MLKQAALDSKKSGYTLVVALDQFLGALAAVAEVSETAEEISKNDPAASEMRAAFERLSSEQKVAVSQAWILMTAHADSSNEDEPASNETENVVSNLSSLLKYQKTSDDSATLNFLDSHAGDTFQFMTRRASRSVAGGSRARLLRRSLLSTAVSSFEYLVGALIEQTLRTVPGILSDSEYSFNLKQLEEFDSIQDAREELRQRRVHALLNDGLDGWHKFFNRRDVGIDMAKLTDDWLIVREFIARRHLLTHKDGVVDQKFVDSVGDYFGQTPEVGDRVFIGPDYMKQGIQSLAGLGCALVYRLWTKFHPDEIELAQTHLVEIQDEMVSLRFWGTVVDIREAIPEKSFVKRDLLLRSSIHRWTAIKFGNFDTEEMRREVEAWDTSGLDDRFGHTKLLLLDSADEAAKTLRKLYEDGLMLPSTLYFNPLYEDVSLLDSVGQLTEAISETSED